MNCKNCNETIENDALFCDNCGAKVIKNRITLKLLIIELLTNVFGWDTRFFITIKTMIFKPENVLQEYINGVRKRYVNPFAFFAIGAAISLLIFNFFADEYMEINNSSLSSIESINTKLIPNYENMSFEEKTKIIANQKKTQEKQVKFLLKYYNLFSFALLPIYAFMAFLTYRKPYNYGEHIVINAYIQGITFLTTNLFFILAVYIHPNFFIYNVILVIGYYLYSYKRLYKISFIKSLYKLIKFISVLLLCLLAGAIVIFIIGVFVAIIKTVLGL